MLKITFRNRKGQFSEPRPARLSYYLHDGSAALRLKLAGPLAGQDVAELEQCWRTALSTIGQRRFVIDVSDLSETDEAGRELLHLWSRQGAEFVAAPDRPLIRL